jgi:hypothetical protein
MATARSFKSFDLPLVASKAQQGDDLIDVYAAIYTDAVFSPYKIDLRDVASPNPHTITITNHCNGNKAYQIGHV